MSEYRLRMENINKAFAGMQALSNAELLVRPGEAHALLGINGAGKSTMIKILSGMYSKDSGKLSATAGSICLAIDTTKEKR